mgnify:CR=1 FL=1
MRAAAWGGLLIQDGLVEALEVVPGLHVRCDEPAARHCLLRVGGAVEVWLVAETESAVKEAAALCKEAGHRVRPVVSEHFLVRDGGVDGVWMRLGAVGMGASLSEEGFSVGASHPAAALAARAEAESVWGYAHLAGRAGSIGEAFVAGHLAHRVKSIRVLRGSQVVDLAPEKVLDAHLVLRLSLHAFSTEQDLPVPAMDTPAYPGVVMTDPPRENAEELLVDTGLSGVRLHGVRIARREPNSLVNLGDSTARDVTLLLHMMRDRVKLQTGIELTAILKPVGRG